MTDPRGRAGGTLGVSVASPLRPEPQGPDRVGAKRHTWDRGGWETKGSEGVPEVLGNRDGTCGGCHSRVLPVTPVAGQGGGTGSLSSGVHPDKYFPVTVRHLWYPEDIESGYEVPFPSDRRPGTLHGQVRSQTGYTSTTFAPP